jgi:hypothetical protein
VPAAGPHGPPEDLVTHLGRHYAGWYPSRKKDTVDEQDILHRIQSLVEEERELRDKAEAAPPGAEHTPDRTRLQRIEEDLDQCWDLLRQRRAKKQYGENPDEAEVRPVKQVEDYRG